VRTILAAAAKRFLPLPVGVTVRTFWGRKMRVVLPEEVSLYIFRSSVHEPKLSAALCALVRPGDTVYDVGAHFGFFSLLAADLVGPSGSVHAFEPTPATFTTLRENLASVPHARAVCCAAWKEDTLLPIHDFGKVYSAYNTFGRPRTARAIRGSEYFVCAKTLDEYVAMTGDPPTFVKIDAESSEYEVLCGMRATLQRHRPAISIEIGDVAEGARLSREAIELVEAAGYVAAEFEDGFVPHRTRDVYEYDNLFLFPEERSRSIIGVDLRSADGRSHGR
jgi:FkbM family methyltransferase